MRRAHLFLSVPLMTALALAVFVACDDGSDDGESADMAVADMTPTPDMEGMPDMEGAPDMAGMSDAAMGRPDARPRPDMEPELECGDIGLGCDEATPCSEGLECDQGACVPVDAAECGGQNNQPCPNDMRICMSYFGGSARGGRCANIPLKDCICATAEGRAAFPNNCEMVPGE